MKNKTQQGKTVKRYTNEQKDEVITFINEYKSKNGRGAQKEAAAKFGISAVTITNWMKASKKKRGRKVGSKNSASPKKTSSLMVQNPEELRRLAAILEEVSELEALVERLASLKEEANQLSVKLLG